MQEKGVAAMEIEYEYPDLIEVWDMEKTLEHKRPKWLRRKEYDFDTN